MRPLVLLAPLLLIGGAGASAALLRPAAPLSLPAEGHEGSAHLLAPAGPLCGQRGVPYVRDDVHAWSSPEGSIPAGDAGLAQWDSLAARTDTGLAELAAKGILTGHGTRADPYVLDRVHVHKDLSLSDTAAYLVVRDSLVDGQLKLNWNGQHLHVHHNRIADLRINENVARTGDNTGGLLERNQIAFIGQMRHFAGVFQDNTVGPKPQDAVTTFLSDSGVEQTGDDEVWNLDGFDLADVHGNDVTGMVNVKLHGHYHGDCFDCLGHNHADGIETDYHNHTDRWTSLAFHDNTIHVDHGTALLYRDEPHAQDDRTAASENNTDLDLPHVHHTRIWLENNTLDGGALLVRVFDSADAHHLPGQEGWLRIAGNRIALHADPSPLAESTTTGIDLRSGQGAHVLLAGNSVDWVRYDKTLVDALLPAPSTDGRTGIALSGWAGSALDIEGNSVRDARTGILARSFDANTTWHLAGNALQAAEALDYDRSVANPPT